MSLDNPLALFDVDGQVVLITGSSGAFGAVAAQCLSGAGCKVALAAGNTSAMNEVAGRCKGETLQINARPDSEEACQQMIDEVAAKLSNHGCKCPTKLVDRESCNNTNEISKECR